MLALRNAPLAAKPNLFAATTTTTTLPSIRETTITGTRRGRTTATTAMLSNGTAGVAVAVDCDERTRLLSDEIVVVAAATGAPSSSATSGAGVAAPVPPTSLPLVHTTATTTPANNNVNNNNNAMVVVSAKNTVNNANTHTNTITNKSKSNSNNNNAAAAASASGATEMATDTTTADDEDLSSDLSDKFPRPQKKPGKLSKLGTKSVGLKRVSFGSSKGSMVETLVFETPTPLSEHVESTFGFDAAADAAHAGDHHPSAAGQAQLASTLASHLPLAGGGYSGDYAKANMDDSGIEVQEESERSIVRVSIYESSQPQQPDYLPDDSLAEDGYPYNTNDLDYPIMAATTATGMQQQTLGLGAAYDRQQSTDSGWDNPFRPGGDLSREADEIVSMIRGGQPITPTEERTIGNGSRAEHADDNCNGGGAVIGESVTKTNLSQNLATAQNGTNSHASATADAGAGKATELSGGGGGGGGGNNNGVTSLGQVSKQVVPGPISASHVVIDEKKSKKKGCCVLQ